MIVWMPFVCYLFVIVKKKGFTLSIFGIWIFFHIVDTFCRYWYFVVTSRVKNGSFYGRHPFHRAFFFLFSHSKSFPMAWSNNAPEDIPPSSPAELAAICDESDQMSSSMEISPSISVCGNIHRASFLPFWRDTLKCGSWHLGVLQDQYKLEFMTEVTPYEEKNNLSARNNPAFVCDQLDAMCSAGIICQVAVKPFCVYPLTVASRELPDGSQKLRLCFDGSRHVNRLLKPMKVKLSHFPKAAEILNPSDYQVSLDLKLFYYHLAIAPEHQKFLGIAIELDDGSRRFNQYTVLAFGIAPAAAIMTSLVKPLIVYLASSGIRITIYIDDAKVNTSSKTLAWQHYQKTIEVFSKAGFVISAEKSDSFSDISQQKLYLRFIMCSVRMLSLIHI